MKYERDVKVRIVSNKSAHGFPVDSVVTIQCYDGDDALGGWYSCYGLDKYGENDSWYVLETDMEKVQ